MDTTHLILLFLAIGVIAFLYSSVGHAGASGYIATMTLVRNRASCDSADGAGAEYSCGFNRHVSILACRAFSWKLFWPFAAAFHSGSVFGWLSATFGFDPENS